MKELIVVIVGIAIIAVLVYILLRGAKKIHWEYKVNPQKTISQKHAKAGIGLFWAATIYHLKSNMGLGYEIAIPLVTAISIIGYYIIKKGIIEGEKK